MWKLSISKNRRKSLEESSEPTSKTTISRPARESHNIVDNDNNDEQDNKSNYKNTETIDALLAQELNALSFQQRETLNEEIHGVNVNQIYDKIKEIEETPQLLKESFLKLQIVLNILQPDSYAYNRCQQLYGDDYNDKNYENENENVDDNKNDDKVIRSTNFINTDEFRIMFLRCGLFDISNAARRLIDFVELMYELYGDVGIQRRIRIDDMSKEEIQHFKGGNLQLLPGRDHAGRRLVIHIAANQTNVTAKSRIRMACYVMLRLADDIETQRKGATIILWYQNVRMFDDISIRRKVLSAISICLPCRIGAAHICIPEEFEVNNYVNTPTLSSDDSSDSSVTKISSLRSVVPANVIKSMIALSIGTKGRSKLRIHTGSIMECLYALKSFGIPSNQIPLIAGRTKKRKRRRRNGTNRIDDVGVNNNVDYDNKNIKLENHIKWLELCQLKESNLKSYGRKWKCHDENKQIIECPNHLDILFGRGMRVMKQPGNILLIRIVVSKLDEYINLKSCKLTETVKLTLDVVHLLKNKYGARFLKEETTESNGNLGCWVEVSNEEARLKVRIAFRDKVKLQQKTDKQQQPQQITTQQQQSQLLISPPIQLPTMMMTTTENNNYNTSNNNNRQIQQYQQVDEENTSSSTSMFLSMAGGSSGCGCDCGSTASKKKR